MKLINLAILTLSLLILSNAQSTEENPSSEDSSSPSDDDTPSEGQTEESTENPESSSSSDDDQEDGAHQSGEPAEGGESTPQSGDDQNHQEGQNQDSKNGNPEEQAGAAKGSYLETYNEIGKILDAVDFKSIEDLHLQRMLENNFQGRLRNPIRSQTGQIADFSAIQSCFGSLGGDVQKLIDDAKKEFETCKAGGDGADSAVCTDQQENKFADGVIAVATTLQGCIASQRKD